MKIKIIVALITIASLGGCTSTVKQDQASAAPAEIKNKINSGKQLTEKELNELAGKANFTSTQLKKAARKLGYRCTYFAVTGSHIKQKICSTQQQRDVRAEAAKNYVRDITRANSAATGQL